MTAAALFWVLWMVLGLSVVMLVLDGDADWWRDARRLGLVGTLVVVLCIALVAPFALVMAALEDR